MKRKPDLIEKDIIIKNERKLSNKEITSGIRMIVMISVALIALIILFIVGNEVKIGELVIAAPFVLVLDGFVLDAILTIKRQVKKIDEGQYLMQRVTVLDRDNSRGLNKCVITVLDEDGDRYMINADSSLYNKMIPGMKGILVQIDDERVKLFNNECRFISDNECNESISSDVVDFRKPLPAVHDSIAAYYKKEIKKNKVLRGCALCAFSLAFVLWFVYKFLGPEMGIVLYYLGLLIVVLSVMALTIKAIKMVFLKKKWVLLVWVAFINLNLFIAFALFGAFKMTLYIFAIVNVSLLVINILTILFLYKDDMRFGRIIKSYDYTYAEGKVLQTSKRTIEGSNFHTTIYSVVVETDSEKTIEIQSGKPYKGIKVGSRGYLIKFDLEEPEFYFVETRTTYLSASI